jgi:hypothetical protein
MRQSGSTKTYTDMTKKAKTATLGNSRPPAVAMASTIKDAKAYQESAE